MSVCVLIGSALVSTQFSAINHTWPILILSSEEDQWLAINFRTPNFLALLEIKYCHKTIMLHVKDNGMQRYNIHIKL